MQRALEKGESPVEGGERPLYSADIQNIIAAYAVEGSSEAMLRKFMVDVAWLSGGRGGEMSNLTWEGLLVRVRYCHLRAYIAHVTYSTTTLASLQIDSQYQVVYTDAVQVKVSAMKTVVFAAGFNRHLDFFLNFFDFLVFGPSRTSYVPGGANFVFPDWQRVSAPSTVLSNVIKTVLPESKSSKYAAVRVASLHRDASAGGIRVGAVNWLTSHMPAEFVAYLTGHKLNGIGALFEYLRVEVRGDSLCSLVWKRTLPRVTAPRRSQSYQQLSLSCQVFLLCAGGNKAEVLYLPLSAQSATYRSLYGRPSSMMCVI